MEKRSIQSIIIGIFGVLLFIAVVIIIVLAIKNNELKRVAYMTETTTAEHSEKTGDRKYISEIDNSDNVSESLYSYVQPELSSDIERQINDYILLYYNYNQNNFVQRLVDIKPYCTEKMYTSMTDGMDLSKEIEFQNPIQSSVTEQIIVLSTVMDTEATAYVALRVYGKVGEMEQTSQMLLEMELSLEDTWKISKIIVLGSGEYS